MSEEMFTAALPKLVVATEHGRKVFVEVEDLEGDLDLAYGLVSSVSVFGSMLVVRFGADSVSLCMSEGWWFQTHNALLLVDADTCMCFEASFEEPKISAHMSDTGVRFMKSNPGGAQRWCRHRNRSMYLRRNRK